MAANATCYLLKCGSGAPKYVEAGMFDDDCILMGTESSGSAFRREERDGGKFQISLVIETPGADRNRRFYVATNEEYLTGLQSIIVGKGKSITCVMESNYIRIVSPREGYLGFEEDPDGSQSVVFVADRSEEKKGSLWLQFEWEQVKVDDQGDVMRGPNLTTMGHPVNPKPNIDKED